MRAGRVDSPLRLDNTDDMDKQKRRARPTKRASAPPKPSELTGKALKYAMEHNEELIEGTKKGYEDFAAGRYSKLEDVKKRLGDV